MVLPGVLSALLMHAGNYAMMLLSICTWGSLQLEVIAIICTASQGTDDCDVACLRCLHQILDEVSASKVVSGDGMQYV